ncbi:MAG: hypothetical protein HOE90_02300 [Bacteriovoracaceae bacterium]|jgi:hypothetical protein|nr:hypothetical protein [Bacteriovoracaceae bacterium]
MKTLLILCTFIASLSALAKCPDFSGSYQIESCQNDDKASYVLFSLAMDLPANEIVSLEQKGCKEVVFSFEDENGNDLGSSKALPFKKDLSIVLGELYKNVKISISKRKKEIKIISKYIYVSEGSYQKSIAVLKMNKDGSLLATVNNISGGFVPYLFEGKLRQNKLTSSCILKKIK